jgi:hypothetical protein
VGGRVAGMSAQQFDAARHRERQHKPLALREFQRALDRALGGRAIVQGLRRPRHEHVRLHRRELVDHRGASVEDRLECIPCLLRAFLRQLHGGYGGE